jgi:hypothetical protein
MKRLRSESNATFHHYQNQFGMNNFDNGSSAMLIEKIFNHLSKETDVLREWIMLEKERMSRETLRRKEDYEREERREKRFLQTLMKMQEQTFSFLSKQKIVQVNSKTLSSLQSNIVNTYDGDSSSLLVNCSNSNADINDKDNENEKDEEIETETEHGFSDKNMNISVKTTNNNENDNDSNLNINNFVKLNKLKDWSA